MEQLYSAAEAARQIGTSRRTIARRCHSAGIGRQLGSGKGSAWILTRQDIERLRAVVHDGPGNPAFRKNQMSKSGQKGKLHRRKSSRTN